MAAFANGPADGEVPQPHQFGPYFLHELINRGGMAEIWLATDESKQTCAVRRLHSVGTFDFTTKKRFFRGCEVLSKISHHPLVISYLNHGKINGTPYCAMEYIEGNNLKLLFAEGDPLLQENIGEILLDMASALEHVHDSGFMHLDYKPENVIVSRNASLRLVDFDLALEKPEKPIKLKSNPGTPAYMAPEQLLRQPLDARVDIFAFGVSAYELLTNEKPFPGETPDEILRKQLQRSDFKRPRELNPDIPVKLEAVILKCIETDMDQRYPYMSVLIRDLQQALYV
ncbi:MAG: serine/threonine-protein kinase [Verrucomicrobiota bacterium]|nr:serine/threonine-protein kinase [Verrucomicrobiota bacterium]